MKKKVPNVTFVEKFLLKITQRKNVDVDYSAIKATMANVISKFIFLEHVSILSQHIFKCTYMVHLETYHNILYR